MKITRKHKALILSIIPAIIIPAVAVAFNWPQEENQADSLFSYFGQLRGGTIESSIIFQDSSPVMAAEDGKLMCLISEHDDEFGWFESTLGNALIMGHKDGFVTVYGNLDGDTVPDFNQESEIIKEGDFIGTSGNSGWQEGRSCLEFQVLDTKTSTSINPRLLMPRIGTELPLEIGNITLEDRYGNTYNLNQIKSIKNGLYSVYRTRQNVAVPYKTIVSINGASVETIEYNRLKENDGRLCVEGNADYSSTTLYPDEKRQLLSQIMLTKGKNTLTIALQDILRTTVSKSFVIDVE